MHPAALVKAKFAAIDDNLQRIAAKLPPMLATMVGTILSEEGVGALASSKQKLWLVEESLAHRIASREPPPPPPAG